MLCLYLEAPFAACRTFTAGWYRPTATFLTPSAAYGLVLNIAGIESRLREEDEGHDGRTAASLMRRDLPAVRIALGVPLKGDQPCYPNVQTIYQQLHNYLVGDQEKVPDPDSPGSKASRGELGLRRAKGNKYNITPVRRELLTDLRAYICLDGNPDLEDRVRRGLSGAWNSTRYGLPFLGDNQFLVDRLELFDQPQRACWYERLGEGTSTTPRQRTTRLTVWIDRAEMSKTRSGLYAPTEQPAELADRNSAWTQIEPR